MRKFEVRKSLSHLNDFSPYPNIKKRFTLFTPDLIKESISENEFDSQNSPQMMKISKNKDSLFKKSTIKNTDSILNKISVTRTKTRNSYHKVN